MPKRRKLESPLLVAKGDLITEIQSAKDSHRDITGAGTGRELAWKAGKGSGESNSKWDCNRK